MSLFKYAWLNYARKPMKNGIIIGVISLILLGELIGLCLYNVSESSLKRSFIYNGPAYYFDGVAVDDELLQKVQSIPHVVGIDSRKWWENSVPVGLSRVNSNTGYKIEQTPEQASHNTMTIMANVDTAMDQWFRWEPVISLENGEYPTVENKGVLVEKRFSLQNNLRIGDEVSYDINGTICNFVICGIYHIDADFELLEDFDFAQLEDIYKYSPYNRVYTNYFYMAPQVGMDLSDLGPWMVYVDSIDNCESVASTLRSILGKDAEIYDHISDFTKSAGAVASRLQNISKLILVYIMLFGCIILLIVLTYYARQYRYDCGIMMALGYEKFRIVIYYLMSNLLLMLSAVIVSIILYYIFGNVIISGVERITNVVSNKGISFYRVKGLEEPFTISASLKDVLSVKSAFEFFRFCFGSYLVLVSLPITVIIQTKPRFLLEE